MTFDELLEEVYTLTKRPDLSADTELAVKAATLKAHRTDFYSRDIAEVPLTLGTTAKYIWSLDIVSYISNFRSIKYIRIYDTVSLVPTTFFEIITPEEVLDSYGVQRSNVAYIAGRNVELKANVTFTDIIFACYVLPIVTPKGFYSSWVADLFPYAIVFEAARVVYKTIGFDEESAAYEKLVAEEYKLLKASALADFGY